MSSKYNSYRGDQDRKKETKTLHPVWRGVGFAFMILIPIMSYALMRIFLEQNSINGWFVPTPDMLAKKTHILYLIFRDTWIYIKIGLYLLCLLVFYMIFMLFASIVNGLFGVKAKDDPFYVPPVRRTTPRSRSRR